LWTEEQNEELEKVQQI